MPFLLWPSKDRRSSEHLWLGRRTPLAAQTAADIARASQRVSALARALELKTRRGPRGTVLDYEADYIALLATRHGITQAMVSQAQVA